jgi:thiol:disulfide interchange protein DsbA
MRHNLTCIAFLSFFILSGCDSSKTLPSDNPQQRSNHSSIDVQESSRFKEGIHYVVKKHLPQSSEPQIIKFISYNCPACRFFESTSKITETENILVERFPVSFSREQWRDTAKAYAVLRSLNIHEQLSGQLFRAVQDQRVPIGDKAFFIDWLSGLTTLTERQIEDAYEHDKVAELLAMYKAAERRYAITSVPSVYINGNIQIKLKALEGETQLERMIFLSELTDHLVAQGGE